jgi:hypothetical protein
LGYPGLILRLLTVVRALGAIRTRTTDVLDVVPLPLGYEGLRPQKKPPSRSVTGERRASLETSA